jgi:hypothetical protein
MPFQARPVTTLWSWTDEDLSRELDSAVASDFDEVHSKANVG